MTARAGSRRGEQSPARYGITLAVDSRDEHLGIATDQLRAAVAEQPLHTRGHVLDLSRGVRDHNRVGSGLEHNEIGQDKSHRRTWGET